MQVSRTRKPPVATEVPLISQHDLHRGDCRFDDLGREFAIETIYRVAATVFAVIVRIAEITGVREHNSRHLLLPKRSVVGQVGRLRR